MKPKINPVLSFLGIISIRPFFVSILLILILVQTLHSQTDSLDIEHIADEQGLSNFSISSIIQDREGYMWFATTHGVERYDGYSFQSYNNNPEDTTSFINASPTKICMDEEGTLWFGTFHGIEKYNRSTNSFTNYLLNRSEKGGGMENIVEDIVADNSGILWVATHKGLYKFNKLSGEFSQVQYDTGSPPNLNYHYGRLYLDKEGSLWYGTSRGLDKLNYKTGKLMHVWNDPENKERDLHSVSKYIILKIFEDNNGILWLGTRSGLVEFNKKSNTFTNYIPDPRVHNPFGINRVMSLCLDPSGSLWVGTGKGIFTFDAKVKKFIHKFIKQSVKDYNLGNAPIRRLYIDNSGTLWAGTNGDGIYEIILKKPQYKKYFPGHINGIVKGSNGILWVNKGLEGWIKFDTKTGQISPGNLTKDQYLNIDSSGNIYLENNYSSIFRRVTNGKIYKYNLLKKPLAIYFDANKGMWYGALQGGLYYLDFNTHKVKEIYHTNRIIITLFKDLSGLLWAATTDIYKLICYDPKNKSASEFISDPGNPSSISGREVFTIYQDKKGRLWFATDAGLNRFIPLTRTFIHFTEKDGLSGNIVYNILEDDHGNLWMDTNKGISKFDPEKNQFKNYGVLQGILSIDFWNHLAVKMDNGEMFFGRSNGLIRFYPDSIKENNYIPPIVITSFRLFDKPVPFDKEIKLTYDKNFLSFEFAALSYYNSLRNQYAYMMEGVDKDWVYSGTRRYASYPNMTPGKYIFRVKGSNNDGIWNETGTSILIIISPPWWKTTWAYISYGLIIMLILYSLRRYELNRIELKDKIKLDTAVFKEKEETDKMKSRFFANISHEFRTPLTLISGPIEKIISKSSDEDIIKDAGIVKRNSKRLLQLVNQLLDLSKLEAGKLKLEAAKSNIVSFVKGISLSFESLSEEKDITLKILSGKEFIELYFDKEKMIKILSNILSNAFKFTPRNGRIMVSIKECHAELDSPKGVLRTASFINGKIPGQARNDNMKGFVEIKIKDTGIGIPQEEIPKLFDRFYQVDSSFTKEYEGTGIGLALTKELIELHHGSISVDSEMENPDNGGTSWTEITIRLPLGKEHLKEEEILVDEKTKQEFHFDEQILLHTETIEKSSGSSEIISAKEDKTIVLVVEDNYDMRAYIKESLEEYYTVEEAVNGEQGLRKAENIMPDLIISDIMMPKLDGNEMTKILKNEEKTSHIPVIILTAKSGQESKLEGLQTEADDYLTKPFDIRELRIKIENLIMIRKKLQEKYGKGEPVHTGGEKKLRKIDEQFLDKVLKIINEHISDENFSIEDFSGEIGMSRTQLHRKLKALVGKSASQYLKSVRLTKAKKMIEEEKGNISEIAYSVGFSSPAYFSRCFKEEFGYPPSDLVN